MQKRIFSKAYFNGFGGKVEKGESVNEAAARELNEKLGVTPVDMSKREVLTFFFDYARFLGGPCMPCV
jgi:8-oxo-dGTP diphosphatase